MTVHVHIAKHGSLSCFMEHGGSTDAHNLTQCLVSINDLKRHIKRHTWMSDLKMPYISQGSFESLHKRLSGSKQLLLSVLHKVLDDMINEQALSSG